MEVISPSTPNGVAPYAAVDNVDPLPVLEHIANLIQTTLGAARRELESVGSLLSKSKYADSLGRCARFAAEPHAALYAQQDVLDDDMVNGHGDGESRERNL